jgi:hypothetical protein
LRRLCLSLLGVTERLSWEQPAWFAKTLMARMWEDGVVTVKTEERDAGRIGCRHQLDPSSRLFTRVGAGSPRPGVRRGA